MIRRSFTYTNFPFLRISIPFAVGILSFGVCSSKWILYAIATLIAACAICHFFLQRTYRIGPWHIVTNLLYFSLFFFLGWQCSAINEPAKIRPQYLDKPIFFNCHITDIAQRNFSTEIYGTCLFGIDHHKIRLTVPLNDYHIHIGDEIECYGTITAIKPPKEPYAFDFSEYMHHKGILYECALNESHYSIVCHNNDFRFWIDKSRRNIIRLIRLAGMNDGASNLAIAFCTGDRSYMPESEKEAFSQAGLAHIMAVSGLHIGIITIILSAIFYPFRTHKLNKVRFVLILTGTWLYVLLTGMPISAIRAAIMVSFVFASKVLLHKHSSINALCASAFFILLFTPNAIYEVGFQLSFLSVTGILLWTDKLTPHFSNKILQTLSSALSVTFAAQLTTFPLIIYYFNYFPTGFFLSNLVIVPVLPILMFLIISAISLAAIGFKCTILTLSVNHIYGYISEAATFCTTNLPPISNIWIDGLSTTLLCALFIILGVMLKFKPNKSMVFLSATLLFATITSNFLNRLSTPKSGCFISSLYESSDLVAYHDNKLFVMNSLNDTTLSKSFIDSADKFMSIQQFDSVIHIHKTTIRDKDFSFSYPFAWISGKSYMFVTGNLKKRHNCGTPIKVNYAILTNRYYNQLSELSNYVLADTVVISKEIFKTRRDTLINYAMANHIPYIAD